MKTYTLTVVETRRETADSITVCFKQPGLKKIKYLAGQYLSLVFRINGRRYVRAYSISFTFGIDPTINVTVKRVNGGIVSNHILDTLKEGDIIECLPPKGNFILPSEITYQTSVYLWAVGSGITPVFAILKQLLLNFEAIQVVLVLGNRLREEVIFKDELIKLQMQFPDRLFVYHFFSRIEVYQNEQVIQGRINPAQLIEASRGLFNAESLHYICGPGGLKASVTHFLNTQGISPVQIYTEDFELVVSVEDLLGVNTQNISVEHRDVKANIEVVRGKSILEEQHNKSELAFKSSWSF